MTTWVLLRGWARETRHWGGFADLLRSRLGEGSRVMALDTPGNGLLNAQRSPATVAGMVQACRMQLERDGVHGPFVLFGLSLGAMIALEWARLHPSGIDAAVLVNGSFGGHAPFWRRLRPGSWASLLAIAASGGTPVQRELRVLELTSHEHRSDEALASRWATYAQERPVNTSNALRQLAAAARFRAPPGAPHVPTLIVTSRGDRLVSHRCSTTPAARWGVPVIVHDSAGHDLPLDDPQWLAMHAASWWHGLPRRS